MKWVAIELAGWLGIGVGALFIGLWLNGYLYAYGV